MYIWSIVQHTHEKHTLLFVFKWWSELLKHEIFNQCIMFEMLKDLCIKQGFPVHLKSFFIDNKCLLLQLYGDEHGRIQT